MTTNLISMTALLIRRAAYADNVVMVEDKLFHQYEFQSPTIEWPTLSADGHTFNNNVHIWTHCDQNGQNGVQKWYAFSCPESRVLWLKMQKADGVGAVKALGILARTHWSEVHKLAEAGDVEGITKLPGAGPKIGAAIAAVLVRKEDRKAPKPVKPEKAPKPVFEPYVEDAILAIMGLGNSRSDAENAVMKVLQQHEGVTLTTSDITIKGNKMLSKFK